MLSEQECHDRLILNSQYFSFLPRLRVCIQIKKQNITVSLRCLQKIMKKIS